MDKGDLDPPLCPKTAMPDKLDRDKEQDTRPIGDRDHPEEPSDGEEEKGNEDTYPDKNVN